MITQNYTNSIKDFEYDTKYISILSDKMSYSYSTCEGIKRHQWGRRELKFWKGTTKKRAKMGKRRNRETTRWPTKRTERV